MSVQTSSAAASSGAAATSQSVAEDNQNNGDDSMNISGAASTSSISDAPLKVEDDLQQHSQPQQPQLQHQQLPLQQPSSFDGASDGQQQPKIPVPVQKRRRVTRACDECRRKKIKCDGKQPCTHCTVYSYECTYDQPSTRRRNPAPQYIEALESRLNKAEAVLHAVLPELDLNDPRYDARPVEEILASLSLNKKEPHQTPDSAAETDESQSEQCDESLLESMVDNAGSLDLDDHGHWDYHGHSSGLIFVQRLRKKFAILPEMKPTKFQQVTELLEASKSASESPADSHLSPLHDLPSRDVARQLCVNALEDSCCIMRFLHKPTFYAMFDRIYDSPDHLTNEEHTFLPLLYLALAVGCLFRGVGDSTLEKSGYETAMNQGFQYFKAGRQLLDITECRDITSLQAICFMILFLQSSANLSTCYSYIGIALRAALRLGLHRSVPAKFNPVELETRKRVFWIVRKMDVHVSTILGLPTVLSEDDIDQEYPLPVEDEYITPTGILPMPPNHISLMAGVNAHMHLTKIVWKVVKYIYPIKSANPGLNHRYLVSHSKIREIERDLQTWMEALPEVFRPGGEASPQVERMRQLLRIAYAHVQIIMYRPFLHYVTGNSQGRGIDKRSYACAAACVSVARNVVHITAGLKKKQLLNGSYWFTMYTTYIAIITLVYYILENPESATTKDGVLKDALEGKNALAGLAKRSMAADRCNQSLNAIFKYLPERLRNRQGTAPMMMNRKRPQQAPASNPPILQPSASSASGTQTPPAKPTSTDRPALKPSHRASTFPIQNTTVCNEKPQSDNRQQSPQQQQHHHPTVTANRPNPWLVMEHSPLSVSQSTSNLPSLAMHEEPTTTSSAPSPFTTSQPLSQETPTSSTDGMSFSPPFNNTGRLPDLMSMMFPSDDPFAYPNNQPMSTLEDDHFKHDAGDTYEHVSLGHLHSVSSGMMQSPSSEGSPFRPTQMRSRVVSSGSDQLSRTTGHLSQSHHNMDNSSSNNNNNNSNNSTRYTAESELVSPTSGIVRENSDLVSLWTDFGNQSLFDGSNSNSNDNSSIINNNNNLNNNQFLASSSLMQSLHMRQSDAGLDMTGGLAGFEGLGMGMGMGVGMNMAMDIDEFLQSTSIGGNGGDAPADWAQLSNWDMIEREN